MYPILLQLGSVKVYGYGFSIMIGALLAYYYALQQSKKIAVSQDTVSEMAILIIASAVVGGKVFLWFANWDYYIHNPSKMFELSGSGFVFYGSFIFCILSLLVFLRIKRIAYAPMFDILAISTALVHGFGKIGCLLAGCCYGKICSPALGIVYHNQLSQAEPLNTPLYPVPILDAIIILGAALLMYGYQKRQRFKGELMLIYVFVYGTGRFFTEFLRGDESRGYLGLLSQSQWVSIGLIIVAGLVYAMMLKKVKTKP
jgi:phosphatidylglycerol---prolipoprotein diacylglyceryl transferase